MKRYGNLFHKITDIDNIIQAHHKARIGKSNYKEVRLIDQDPKHYAEIIKNLLESKKFTTSNYIIFDKVCGRKKRKIYKLPYFPDRIVQHAVMQIVEPILTATLIRDTFQSIKRRGTHDCRKRIQKAINQLPNDSYVLKVDIKKYYPSIDNDIMKSTVRQKIKCKDTLWILDDIIDSTNGLPIGNYTSQVLGNFYLSSLDHCMKEVVKIKHYYRYCDDIVIIDSKDKCKEYKNILFENLGLLKLTVKDNWQIFPLKNRHIDYVGWLFTKKHTKLRHSTKKNLAKKAKYFKRNHKAINKDNAKSSIMSYWGQVKYINSKRVWHKYVDNELKTKISL